jgi:hypothetical protein
MYINYRILFLFGKSGCYKHGVEKIKGRRSLLECVSLFPYARHALLERISFSHMRDVLQTDESPFILSRPAWYRSLVPPRLLELMLTSF